MISRFSYMPNFQYMSNFQRVFVVPPGQSAVEYQNARDARNQKHDYTENLTKQKPKQPLVQKVENVTTTPLKPQTPAKDVRKPLKIFNKRNAIIGAAGLTGLWGLSSLHESLTNPNKYMNNP